MKPQIVTYVGRKGGVGKTAMTVSTADERASRGRRVLVIDMDPQANATSWLGVTEPKQTMNDVLYSAKIDGALNAAIVPTAWDGVWVAPAEEDLAGREADAVASSELRLRRVLRTADLSGFDDIIIDSPPSLGVLMLNALNAAKKVVIVTDSERGGVSGVGRVASVIAVVMEDSNQELDPAGIVMNKYDASTSEHPARWAELGEVYEPWPRWRLPKRAAVATAYGASVPPRRVSGGAPFVMLLGDMVTNVMEGEHDDHEAAAAVS